MSTRFSTYLLGIWVALGMILGFAMPPIVDNSSGLRLYARQIGYFHIPMAVAMIVAFLVSAFYGVQWLRKRDVRDDALSLAYAEVGTMAGVVATLTGAVFARVNWGMYWSWDPQQIGVLVTLLTYAALFALRGAVEDEQKRRNLWAVYAIFGCLTACFASVVYRRLLPDGQTLHPKNTLLYSDRLIQFALTFNIVAYVFLLAKVANLRARLETSREKLQEMSWTKV